VVHHGEAILLSDAQQDARFYPSVDQTTGFTTRAMICVPLLIKDRPIGVIQAISRSVGTFSGSDLYFMNTLSDVAALAIENARLYTLEKRARHQAETLKRVAETVGSSLSLEQVLALALEQLQSVVPCDSAAIFVREGHFPYQDVVPLRRGHRTKRNEDVQRRDQEGEYLKAIAARGFDDLPTVLEICEPVTNVPLFRQMCMHKRPIAIVDAQADGRYVWWAGTKLTRSWIGIPMIAKGQVIGQVSIDRHRIEEFTLEEIEIASTFARPVAGAITNALLYSEARDRADELSILNEVAMAVSTSLELETILERALDALQALLALSGAGISLLDESGTRLTLLVERGLSPWLMRMSQETSVRDDSALGSVLASHQTLILESQAQEEGSLQSRPGDGKSRGGVFVPLLARDAVLGILLVQYRDRSLLSPRQLALLEAIGRQIGIAIDNARLYERIQRSRERYRHLAENARAIIYRARVDGTVEYVNSALGAVTGYVFKELSEGPDDLWASIVHPDDIDSLRQERQRLASGLEGIECEYRIVRKDGAICHVHESGALLRDDSGQVVGWEGIVLDTTDSFYEPSA
jgi:PAS domain S-box-containing protein